MSPSRAQLMRSLSGATTRPFTRPIYAERFQRGYATEERPPRGPSGEGGPPGEKKPFPFLPIAVAVSLPAFAWFFMGSSPTPTDRSVLSGEKPTIGSGGPNEEQSRSVPQEQPASKATKPANPKAVAPDSSRLDSEKAEKSNTLTGTRN
ncbi:uncharacterized protein DNG_09562 [Cephalotrichum gorgonifer]|uniref:Uncharacterized protein n=1 Tax=Cephalotrichum gorgonifer TaxID=2041049 RepID=A0AAE8SZJ8_9PEZI|nr:uncharacterized protein DNG_09562 [Cephalotrichum gorgonifer]